MAISREGNSKIPLILLGIEHIIGENPSQFDLEPDEPAQELHRRIKSRIQHLMRTRHLPQERVEPEVFDEFILELKSCARRLFQNKLSLM